MYVMTVLLRVNLQSLYIPIHQSNNIDQVNGKENSIKYLHVEAFTPVQDSWERSVNRGYFNTWPGILAKGTNNMPKSEATIKGHLTQIRNHTQSTTTNKNNGKTHMITDPIQEQHNGKTEIIMATLETNYKIYTYKTGKLPMMTSIGNKYVITISVCGANAIFAEPLNSRSGSHILEAYTKQVEQLINRGYRPWVH